MRLGERMKIIDPDKLKEKISEEYKHCLQDSTRISPNMFVLDVIPDIIDSCAYDILCGTTPVTNATWRLGIQKVRYRQDGVWKDGEPILIATCTNCDDWIIYDEDEIGEYKYCRNCGAKMEVPINFVKVTSVAKMDGEEE